MTRLNLYLFVLLLPAMLGASRTAHAAASYDNCTDTITSLPAVISSPGTYCLKADLSTANVSGNAITINSNDVTIDCNDFKLGGLAAGLATLGTGISATDRFNITVRHCNIRGFYVGTDISSSTASSGGGHVIEDNRFDGNTYIAIEVHGDGSVVRRNRVFNSGGSTWIPDAFGIDASYSVDVLDNTVSQVVARVGGNGFAIGIEVSSNPNGRIIGNGVRGLAEDGTGKAYGIFTGADRLTLRNNDVVGDSNPASYGLICSSTNSRAMDNTISGFATARSVCNDSGGNVVIP